MYKHFTRLAVALAAVCSVSSAVAQDNILAEKPVKPLGDFKTWTKTVDGVDQTFTQTQAELDKLTAVPTNTSNIYLFPEAGGGWATDANKAIGIQGFYVDMGEVKSVDRVTTTWEGAAANAYAIYLTETEPTPAILDTEATYSATGLGQYQSNVAALPAGAKGRYLVFQPTDATNWGWGVKIRSISAIEPFDAELTGITVSPAFAVPGQATELTFSYLNQVGEPFDGDVTLTVSENATLADGKLTINSGTSATVTATSGDKSVTATVYAVNAPAAPVAAGVKTAIFLSNDPTINATYAAMNGYNGGATDKGVFSFPEGEQAVWLENLRCTFFGNTATLGAWGTKFSASEKGFRNLHIEIFSPVEASGHVQLEGAGVNYDFTLTAGEWNFINMPLTAIETEINNYSIRFDEANMVPAALITNVYFTPLFIEGDEEAPVLGEITATAEQTSATFTFSATDDKNPLIDYTISDGTNNWLVSAASGEEVTHTVEGLEPGTEYTFTVTASDGLNASEPKTVTVTTDAFPAAPAVDLDTEKYDVVAVYSTSLNATTVPAFDAWTSTAKAGTVKVADGSTVLLYSDYLNQWGGMVNLEANLTKDCTTLHIDIYGIGDEDGKLKIAPVWGEANGATTPDKFIDVKAGEWTSAEVALSEFGYPDYGQSVIQFAMNESSFPSFAIDNFYFYGEIKDDAIDTIEAADANAPVEYFNLQGVRVENPANGLFIRRQGNTAVKVLVK